MRRTSWEPSEGPAGSISVRVWAVPVHARTVSALLVFFVCEFVLLLFKQIGHTKRMYSTRAHLLKSSVRMLSENVARLLPLQADAPALKRLHRGQDATCASYAQTVAPWQALDACGVCGGDESECANTYAKRTAHAIGDPHYLTLDGISFDYQAFPAPRSASYSRPFRTHSAASTALPCSRSS